MRSRRPRPPWWPPVSATVVVVLACVVLGAAAVWWRGTARGSVHGSPPRDHVVRLLAAVADVPERHRVPGYQRRCDGASACVFGPAWSDATSAPAAGNGCSTRDDVLRRDLRGTRPDPRNPCRVVGGTLIDPYTGQSVDIARRGVRAVHVDHVVPLSVAWDLGASEWPADRRAAFANDVALNLLAVGEQVNQDKGDKTPGDWMPPAPRWRCHYAARYLAVARTYELPVTRSDRRALAEAARRCPT